MRSLDGAYQLKYSNFHGTLVEVCRLVLHNLDGDDFVRPDVLAFCDLTKGPLTQDVED